MASVKSSQKYEFKWQNLEITRKTPKREVWVENSGNPENIVRRGPWNCDEERKVKPKIKITSPKKGILRLASKFEIQYLKLQDSSLKKTILNDFITENTDKVESLKERLRKRRAARKKENENGKNVENEFVVVDNLEDAEKDKICCSDENLNNTKKKKIINYSGAQQNENNEDKSDSEILYSAEELCKFEFNLQFSLRRISSNSFQHDFCVLTAASCIRGSRQFREYLQKRKTEVKSKGRDITENGNAALVLAESTFLKICERIEQSKDENVLGRKEFLALVTSLQSSSAAEKFYKSREQIFIETVRPELKKENEKKINL